MIVRVSDDAERDLADGAAFYDQHGYQIGDHFLHSLLGDLQALSVLGGVHGGKTISARHLLHTGWS